MIIIKFFKYSFLYFLYFPIVDNAFRKSVINILKFKLLYEKQNNIAFYDSSPSHYGFSSLLINKYTIDERVVLFAGDISHPAFKTSSENLVVLYLDRKFKILFLLLNIPIMITFSSGFPKVFKPRSMHLIHLFHSIVSINYTYDNGSFDAYDTIFAVGPHHLKELKNMAKIRNWENKNYVSVGYPKIEYLVNLDKTKLVEEEKVTILFAPTWGNHNVLKLYGIEIIDCVLALGYKIIVRPHPLSFINDIETIEKIKKTAEENINCDLENSNFSSMSSYLKSDLMISDWSGAAYEYAFSLLKPVLFVEAPMKINNSSQIEKSDLPMEFICRERIGEVTNMNDFEYNLQKIINEENFTDRIKLVREDYIFNPNNSIDIAVNEINKVRLKYQN
jgi:YidC/Oxa1 family membrane protein insertase